MSEILEMPKPQVPFLTYVINMDEAPDRMAHMSAELKRIGIPFIRQAGVVGMKLPYPNEDFSDWSYKYLHGRGWAPRELGCYLSHIECLRSFLRTDSDYALILEDDVRIAEDLTATLALAMNFSADWNMLRLSTVNHGKWWSVRRLGDKSLAVCLTREKGAGGYMVDRVAAACMLKRLMPMRLAWDIAFDLEWLLGFKTLGVYPLPIDQNSGFETQIQQDLQGIKLKGRGKYLTVVPFRLCLEVSRLFYRSVRLLLLKIRGMW
jgi:glycosyl transferase, family 25